MRGRTRRVTDAGKLDNRREARRFCNALRSQAGAHRRLMDGILDNLPRIHDGYRLPEGKQTMAYGAEINRENPTSIVFLVDQSKSMAGPFGKQPEKKKA